MSILVTGGLGYIGSHTVVELNKSGFDTLVIDNLSNSHISVLENLNKITGKKNHFENIDLTDKNHLKLFFEKHKSIEGVIHFAAYKSVSESVNNPLKYFNNNLISLINLLELLSIRKIENFIFSSSASVYGNIDTSPIKEYFKKIPASPYAETKLIGEKIIFDFSKKNKNFKSISLRYFNPIGAHDSLLIGELPIGQPQNLIPRITQSISNKIDNLCIYGNDYNTRDGTCVRDYIHVMDVAESHVYALKQLINSKDLIYDNFNVGTGEGKSVLEIINCFEKTNKLDINFSFSKRRAGDVESIYADVSKINKQLNWYSKYKIEDALKSAWMWQEKLNKQ